MSPAVSTSAARQSLKPAFVSSLSSLTSLAGISITGFEVLILFSFSLSGFRPYKLLQKWPGVDFAFSTGPTEGLSLAPLLAGFLVGRNSGSGRFDEGFGALDEVAFLLLVLLVG